MITISRKINDKVATSKVFENIDILQYHTKTCRRYKKGLIIASVNYEKRKVSIGWSLCNTAQGDDFDKLRGISIALGRLEQNTSKLDKDFIKELHAKVPHSMHAELAVVIDRCTRMLNPKKKKNKI